MPKSLAMIDFRYMIFSNTSGHNMFKKIFCFIKSTNDLRKKSTSCKQLTNPDTNTFV